MSRKIFTNCGNLLWIWLFIWADVVGIFGCGGRFFARREAAAELRVRRGREAGAEGLRARRGLGRLLPRNPPGAIAARAHASAAASSLARGGAAVRRRSLPAVRCLPLPAAACRLPLPTVKTSEFCWSSRQNNSERQAYDLARCKTASRETAPMRQKSPQNSSVLTKGDASAAERGGARQHDATGSTLPTRRAADAPGCPAILFNLSQSHGEDAAELASSRARVRNLLFRFVLIPPIGPGGCASWRALPQTQMKRTIHAERRSPWDNPAHRRRSP